MMQKSQQLYQIIPLQLWAWHLAASGWQGQVAGLSMEWVAGLSPGWVARLSPGHVPAQDRTRTVRSVGKPRSSVALAQATEII